MLFNESQLPKIAIPCPVRSLARVPLEYSTKYRSRVLTISSKARVQQEQQEQNTNTTQTRRAKHRILNNPKICQQSRNKLQSLTKYQESTKSSVGVYQDIITNYKELSEQSDIVIDRLQHRKSRGAAFRSIRSKQGTNNKIYRS